MDLSFKMNPNYKNTEVGTIPSEWKVKKVKQIANINELNIDKNFKCEEIDYIDISSIKEGRITKTKRFLTDQAPSRAKRIVRDNDILISSVRPNLRHYTFIKKSAKRLIASTGFTIITSKRINPHYLYYYLTSDYYTRFLTCIADTHTSAYPAFTPDVIGSSLIPYPPDNEQDRIGNILSNFDTKIELNINLNRNLLLISRTLFNYWFIDLEFPNDSGNPYKSSGGKMVFSTKLGDEIPETWNVGSIGDLVQVQPGYAFRSVDFLENGSIGVVKIRNILDNIVDIKNTQYVSREIISNLDDKYSINPGSILIAMTGANVGKIGIVPKTKRELWLNQRVGMFKEKIDKGLYITYFMLTNDKFQRILRNRAFGTAQQNISSTDIESIEIVIPPRELIARFGLFFEPFYQGIIQNLYENEKLSELRDTLLPKLVFGQLRVE